MKSEKRLPGGVPAASLGATGFRIPHLPVEWLGGASWRLPSGKALIEFALQAGFLAPTLIKATVFGAVPPPARKKTARARGAEATPEIR
ncbi:MAG: hypothetical protein M1541_10710 [Acidobacteria bacterium]|nr:hypothetical protein [Acidobacteriota bacterium]